ncbi:prepilin peptidase [Umezawaea beigongshangensis]|uniref:prepilin peptidase n=1 Tax=Umezawaea beigongshangensis TaxID=2780383 RepID=UPI001E30816B|nr:A24 family peptidase [Umezawaea beigongshangensis]
MFAVLGGGWFAGAIGARLLGALARGTSVGAVPCAAAVAVLWAVAALHGGPPTWLPVVFALAWFGVLLGLVDLTQRRLPDALTLSAFPVLATAIALHDPSDLPRAASGAVVFGAAHLLVAVLVPSAMGGGDVKLAFTLGAVLGAVSWYALLVGAVLACAVTLVLGLVARRSLDRGIPHGPGLLVATWVVAVFAL